MKLKSLRILLIVTVVLASLATVVKAESQLLADTDDNFEVTSPIPNAVVQGTISTVFKIYDDDQTDVPYQISLLDASQCNTQQALIARGDSTSSKTDSNSVSWSTYGPTVDQTTIADGAYCQLVCVSLKNGISPYTACNARIINVRNNNHAPKITSTVPTDLNISPTDAWDYTVQATDVDNDNLTFRFSANPSFLEIDSATGVISVSSTTKLVGTYPVTVVVDDGKGGTATQSWNLVVSGTGSGSSSSANSSDDVTITSPTATSVFSDTDNKITWTASDAQGIDSFNLSYASFPELATFTDIAQVNGDKTSYTWDVTGIPSGTYAIRIEMTDVLGNQVSEVSQEFEINNGDNSGSNSSALIIDVSPADEATITDTTPEISGKFSPPTDGSVDTSTFSFKLDDEDLTANCTVDTDGFVCAPSEELSKGSHKVEASVSDNNAKQTSVEWTFTIADASVTTPVTNSASSGTSITTILLGILGVIILILLFVIPWILYVRWRKQQQTKVTVTTSTTDVPGTANLEPLPELPGMGVSPAAAAVVPNSAQQQPAAAEVTTVAPDPLNYPSYQDYLNAVAEGTAGLVSDNQPVSTPVSPEPVATSVEPEVTQQPEPEVVVPEPVEVPTEPATTVQPTPEFTEMPESKVIPSLETPAPTPAVEPEPEVVQPQPEPLQSASGLPDWLTPVAVENPSSAAPLPAANMQVAAPATPASAPATAVTEQDSSLPTAPVQPPLPAPTAAPEDMLAEHSLPPLPGDFSGTNTNSNLTETGIAEQEPQS